MVNDDPVNELQPQPRARKLAIAGFTLIELLIVITIIGILAGVAVVNVRNAQQKASENALRYDLAQLRKAIDDFYADKQRYPSSLQELVETHYLRRLPVDPITKSSTTWVEVREEPDPSAPTNYDDPNAGNPGIVDVKSGAEGQTLDDPPVPYGDL